MESPKEACLNLNLTCSMIEKDSDRILYLRKDLRKGKIQNGERTAYF